MHRVATFSLILDLAANSAFAGKATGIRRPQKQRDIFDILFEVQKTSANQNLYGGGLKPKEKEFFKSHPTAMQIVREAMTFARTAVEKICGPHADGDESDALRHFTMSCYISSRIGARIARKFTTAHEEFPDDGGRWDDLSRMDIYNNEQGMACGELMHRLHPNENPFSPGKAQTRLYEIAKAKLRDGKLSILWSNGCMAGAAQANRLHEQIPTQREAYRHPAIPGEINSQTAEAQH